MEENAQSSSSPSIQMVQTDLVNQLSKLDVEATMDVCDAIGTKQFLKNHGYGVPSNYARRQTNGQNYPAKAIIGVALGKLPDGKSLKANEFFKGFGEKQAFKKLEELGYEIVTHTNDEGNTRLAVETAMDAFDNYQSRGDHAEHFDLFGPPRDFWVRSTRDRENRVYPSKSVAGYWLKKTRFNGGWSGQAAAALLHNAGFIIVDQNDEPIAPPEKYNHLAKGAERVRQCALSYFVEPARESGLSEVSIQARELATAIHFTNQFPTICSALGGKKFQQLAGVLKPSITGPNPSSTTVFNFKFEALVEQTHMSNEPHDNPSPPKNQILYGPPGTGKTYHTVNKALEIIDPKFYDLNKTDRTALNIRFRELTAAGTIGFVTFHQSFSYEDFVEGLRANAEEGNVSYDIEDGIFKVMCKSEKPLIDDGTLGGLDIAGRQIWKMSLGNTLGSDSYIFDNCIESNEIRLGYGENTDFSQCSSRDAIMKKMAFSGSEVQLQDFSITAVDLFKNQMTIGDLVVISDGNTKFRAIAEIKSDYKCYPDVDFGHYGQVRKVVWHKVYESSLPYQRIMDKKFSQMTIYKLKPKALNLDKFQSFLQSSSDQIGKGNLIAGTTLGNSNHTIESVGAETIRVRSSKTGSTIPFDYQILSELVAFVRQGKLTIEDIAKKRVFEKVDTKLEKYLVGGYPGVFSKLVEVMIKDSDVGSHEAPKYGAKVLIIDEINRGNISSIFGELITLIEPSKRAGADEALSVTLPYSKDTFQVPSNLYLIGTMNTADRSLALMDTALRRRFDFVEMMPDIKLLDDVRVNGISISKVLSTMNRRIEVLYDREHSIGHAFFMPLKDEPNDEKCFELLKSIFSKSILPLLEEYFFEDWAKIRLVLGDDNKEREHQFILENGADFDAASLFGKNAQLDYAAEENKSFNKNADAFKHRQSYVGIYEN